MKPGAALIFTLLVAASLHFILIGDHANESPVLAAGFLAAAVIQLIQAGLIAVRRWPSVLRSVIFLNVLLIGLYLAHVLIGLPLPIGPGGSLWLSEPETIDAYGLVTITAEAIAVILAYRMLLRPEHSGSGQMSQPLRRQGQ